jgi:hypothetical protein
LYVLRKIPVKLCVPLSGLPERYSGVTPAVSEGAARRCLLR